MSNGINRIMQNEKEAKERKITDLKESIRIAANTIGIIERTEMKGREAFIFGESLSWLHTIKGSLDAELLKLEPKKDDPKKSDEPSSENPGHIPPADQPKTTLNGQLKDEAKKPELAVAE